MSALRVFVGKQSNLTIVDERLAWDIDGNDDNSLAASALRASAVAADGRKVFHNAVSAKTCVLGPEPGKVSYLLA